MDRMNKEQIIELVESLGIDYDNFIILSSASLVLRDLFESAGDLDLAVNEKGLQQLKEKYDVINTHDNWYRVNERVECALDDTLDDKREKVGKYYLQDLEDYRNFLLNSTREKDKIRLEIVNKALNK